MGKCKDCRHFKMKPEKNDRGSCDLMGDYNDVIDRYEYSDGTVVFGNDRAYGWDAEGYAAGVTVGINFGCIHFSSAKNK